MPDDIYRAAKESISNECFRLGYYIEILKTEISEAIDKVRNEMIRPSVLYKPTISLDGNQYCALYGGDLMSGIAGFGESPEEAMRSFDKAWIEKYSRETNINYKH